MSTPYPNGYTYRIPITLTNGSSTSAISYGQVSIPITGAAYTSVFNGCTNYPVDIALEDTNNNAIPFVTEDSANISNTLLLIGKVSVPANGSLNAFLYYGNSGASSPSSWTGVIQAATSLSSPTIIYNQTGSLGPTGFTQNVYSLVFQHQGGVNGGGASLNGSIFVVTTSGGTSNGTGHNSIWATTSAASPISFSTPAALLQVSATNIYIRALGEMVDGTLLMLYENVTSGNHYVAKSTNGGTTWSNLAAAPSGNALSLLATLSATSSSSIFQDSAGNFYMGIYGVDPTNSNQPTAWLISCPAADNPTNGSNWGSQASIGTSATLVFQEPAIFFVPGSTTNMIAVLRQNQTGGNGDLYISTSSNTGSTWSAPARMNIPNTPNGPDEPSAVAVAPCPLVLASGNILLSWGVRYGSNYGIAMVMSTDGGTTWLDRPPVYLRSVASGSTNVFCEGESFLQQMANGTIIAVYQYDPAATNTTTNVAYVTFTEEWAANAANYYSECTSTSDTGWTCGAGCTASETQVHDGTHSFKLDNTASEAATAIRIISSSDPNLASNSATVSMWTYITQVAVQAVTIGHQDSTPTYRVRTIVAPGTDDWEWYDGSEYHNTGVAATLNVWQKTTMSVTGADSTASGTYYQNNTTLISNAIGQSATGNPLERTFWQAGSITSENDVTFYLADVYTAQYLPAIPTLTLGAQQTYSASTGAAALLAMM
jgi:hypothetical protein